MRSLQAYDPEKMIINNRPKRYSDINHNKGNFFDP